jgi:hypothetical protein
MKEGDIGSGERERIVHGSESRGLVKKLVTEQIGAHGVIRVEMPNDFNPQRFAGVVVDNVQRPKPTPGAQRI